MTTTKTEAGAPTLAPQRTRGSSSETETGGLSRPVDRTEDRMSAVSTDGAGAGAPVLMPPGTQGAAAVAVAGVTGTWTTVGVDATWSINETRNAFFHVTGGGWKKIFNGTDGAFMALVTLAGQAKQTGRQIQIREEADGLVHEIYLW